MLLFPHGEIYVLIYTHYQCNCLYEKSIYVVHISDTLLEIILCVQVQLVSRFIAISAS
uniref:Uncharacterized protein n=1 Tax=Setaria italica TaxID=4555 RepID=K3Z1Q8_SETIT